MAKSRECYSKDTFKVQKMEEKTKIAWKKR